MIEEELTSQIIKAFYEVYNTLGYGFLEKVYEKALLLELSEMGFVVRAQMPIDVYYSGEIVGEYFADLVIENKVILEIKTAEAISNAHESQTINYLRATNIEVGLILNFGQSATFKRKAFANSRKSFAKNDSNKSMIDNLLDS
ncbi:MAG: GxxExxY protein [Aridibacter sp.]|jgi:GxxExxY protein